MPNGYIGSPPKQVVKNNGVHTISEVFDLQSKGHWGGSLELIQSQSSGTSSTLEFTSIKETKYRQHILHIEDYLPSVDNRHLGLRMMVSGSADTDSDYEYATQQQSASTGAEVKSTGDSKIWLAYGIASDSDRGLNGYIRIYMAGDSSVYTSMTSAFTHFNKDDNLRHEWSSGFYRQNAVVDGFHFMTSGDNLATGTFSLYGVKDIGVL
tara:strand:+ start:31 stop:657 length:627 start_codon:yes stop_codon:yes gene_type:complete